MIAYLDSSVLVKKYVIEPGTPELLDLWNRADAIAISTVGYAEVVAAFHRKRRETNLAPDVARRLTSSFKSDWETFVRVDVSPLLHDLIDRLVAKHPLRGFDAIHLASAIFLRESLGPDLVFACADSKLSVAAKSEGLSLAE